MKKIGLENQIFSPAKTKQSDAPSKGIFCNVKQKMRHLKWRATNRKQINMKTKTEQPHSLRGKDHVHLDHTNTYQNPTPVGRHLMKITDFYQSKDHKKTEMVLKLRSFAPNEEGKYLAVEKKYPWDAKKDLELREDFGSYCNSFGSCPF